MVVHQTTWRTSAAQELLAKHCGRLPTLARYVLDILTGNIPAGRMVFLAVERFLNDLDRAERKDPGFPYFFDQGAAGLVIKYFALLCPFKLEPFQQFIVGNIFGWKVLGVNCEFHPRGHRRFQTCYAEMGKGSGKTPLVAGISTFGVIADGEPGAEIYIAAPSKEQAAICFRDAVRIVDNSPDLSKEFKQHGCNGKMLSGNLSHGTSFIRPISAEHKTLDGPRPHMVVADELHEHKTTLVLDKLTAGFKARHQPLDLEITNSGWDRDTICFYHHDYSRQVLEGIVKNEQWFAYVCQLDVCPKCRAAGKDQPTCDDCDNWLDEAVWIKANPGLGTILQKDYIHKQVKQGLEIPATRNLILRLNFCIWTQSEERFIAPEQWRACSGDEVASLGMPSTSSAWFNYMLLFLKGMFCYGGLDLGAVNDMSCLALYFPKQKNLLKDVLMLWTWAPKDVEHHRILKERFGYNEWVADGFLKLVSGPVTDYPAIREDIKQINRDYFIHEIAFDRRYAFQLQQELSDDGITMVEHGQGTADMTGPIKEFQRRILGREFMHGSNPILTFMVDNLVVKSDGKGNLTCVKPDNPKSPRKIDGAVASIMAMGRAAANPNSGSVYETRGVQEI